MFKPSTHQNVSHLGGLKQPRTFTHRLSPSARCSVRFFCCLGTKAALALAPDGTSLTLESGTDFANWPRNSACACVAWARAAAASASSAPPEILAAMASFWVILLIAPPQKKSIHEASKKTRQAHVQWKAAKLQPCELKDPGFEEVGIDAIDANLRSGLAILGASHRTRGLDHNRRSFRSISPEVLWGLIGFWILVRFFEMLFIRRWFRCDSDMFSKHLRHNKSWGNWNYSSDSWPVSKLQFWRISLYHTETMYQNMSKSEVQNQATNKS